MSLGGLLLQGGEDAAELLLGCGKALAAELEQLGGAARHGGEGVDVALVGLHLAENLLELLDGLCVGWLLYGVHCYFEEEVSVRVEVAEPSAKVVVRVSPGRRPAALVTACPPTRVIE